MLCGASRGGFPFFYARPLHTAARDLSLALNSCNAIRHLPFFVERGRGRVGFPAPLFSREGKKKNKKKKERKSHLLSPPPDGSLASSRARDKISRGPLCRERERERRRPANVVLLHGSSHDIMHCTMYLDLYAYTYYAKAERARDSERR